MNKLVIVLIALFSLVLYIQALPINCSSGLDARVMELEEDTETMDFEDVEEAAVLFTRSLRKGFSSVKKSVSRGVSKAIKKTTNVAKQAKKVANVAKKAKAAARKIGKSIKKGGKFMKKYSFKGAHYVKFGGTFVGNKISKYGSMAGRYIASKFLTKNTLRLPFNSLNQKCQEKFVCAVDCSQIVPKCKEVVFFSDFLENVHQSQRLNVFSSYLTGCIKRSYDHPSEQFWMRDALVKYVNEAKQFPIIPKVNVKKTEAFHNILVTIGRNPGQLIPQYLGSMAELFLTFRQMCHEDPAWKKNVEDRINQLLDNDASIKQTFKGNRYLSDYFSSKLAEMKNIEKKFSGVTLNILYRASFERVARNFKNSFIERVRDGKNGYVCECPKFMQNNRAFPHGKALAEEKCQAACKKAKPANVLEEIEMEL